MGLLNKNDRVMAMQNQAEITPIVHTINSITQKSGIPDWTGGVSYLKVTENNIKWVLEKFGRKCPSNYDFPWFKKAGYFGIGGTGVSYDQPKWDQAWEWYDAYKSGAIPFLEYRIQIREKEMEEDEKNLADYKSEIKPNRLTRGLIKTKEKRIPERKAEIFKLKRELESLKAKEMQKQQEKQPELTLENENLRLKKEILEMELKLKEADRER